jgi:pimeloyl-ACP methyl ester carboxylesterase
MSKISRSSVALGAAGLAGVAAWTLLYRRYRRDIGIANERLAALGSRVVNTTSGLIEYAERGEGYPVLVVHGIFGGFDQGLTDAGSALGEGYRLIVPSRFGYLRTPMPPAASPASQADAHAALLDTLGIDRVVVAGYSAGSTSAIQFALRFPGRVSALLLVSPNAPGPAAAAAPPPRPAMSLLFRTDFLVWLAINHFPAALRSPMGVPRGLELTPEYEAQVAEMMRTVLPAKPRGEGFLFDMYVSNPGINAGYPFGEIVAPTLVVSAVDDPTASYADARGLSELIPGARLVTVASGGHLNLGHREEVDREIRSFLEELRPELTRSSASSAWKSGTS